MEAYKCKKIMKQTFAFLQVDARNYYFRIKQGLAKYFYIINKSRYKSVGHSKKYRMYLRFEL